jgi:adenosylhomocysteine nucleosidase
MGANPARPTGIMSAMPEELAALVADLEQPSREEIAGRDFHSGSLYGRAVVLVVSRCGKVAAASTATILIERFGVDAVVFTGLAGAIAPDLRVGDIVIADRLIQHDLDARPLFPRYQVPLLGVAEFATDPARTAAAASAARGFDAIAGLGADVATAFAITRPNVRVGMIASGDQFFASMEAVADLRARLPDVLAVEMEGAAVAQVCREFALPCAILRTISDTADHTAHLDFPRFLSSVCGPYARALVRGALA